MTKATPWFLLPHPDATRRLGRLVGERLVPGLLVALVGDLGAGKTSLAKATVASLGAVGEEDVVSPTFVLAVEYPGRIGVLHLDAYRLAGPGDLEALGFDLGQTEQAVLLEWADRVEAALPADRLTVFLEHDPGGGRRAMIEAGGARALEALAGLDEGIARAGFPVLGGGRATAPLGPGSSPGGPVAPSC